MNPNLMPGLWLLLLFALSALSVVGARGGRAKLINLTVLLGSMVVAVAIGYLIGAWDVDYGSRAAASLVILFGAGGALACLRRNHVRNKELDFPFRRHK